MARRIVLSSRWAVVISAVVGGLFLLTSVAQAATITLVDQTIAGPLGGAKLCVDSTCKTANGIKDLHIVVTFSISSLTVPVVTLGPAPDCAGTVSLAATVTSLGGSGTIGGSISYQPVDANGANAGPPVVLPIAPPPVSVPPQSHTISICGSAL